MKIAFLLYPTATVRTDEDSSFWIMHELGRRGHEVCHFESRHLFAEPGPKAFVYRSKMDPRKGFALSSLSPKPSDLFDFDAVFIRKEPPFDNSYLHALQILDLLKGRVFMMNDPRGIAMFNEKLSILHFPELVPATMVTDNPALARNFIDDLKKQVVVKPLHEKAGSGILTARIGDKNLPSILDVATSAGKNKVMVQEFIRVKGLADKRILLLNGEFLGVFARKPAPSDFRSNLSVGGSMHKASLTSEDKRIIDAIAPTLVRNGLYFAGIDVMGPYLTEINVTSPSGIPEINALCGTRLQKKVADFIESRV